MSAASEYAVLDGRRWVVSEQALAAVASDKRWLQWDEKPSEFGGEDGPALLFSSVRDRSFDLQLELKAALAAGGVASVPNAVIDALIDASFQCRASVLAPNDATVVLYRTDTGGRLHLPDCPHVRAVDLIEATPDERQDMEVCLGWCDSELTGAGRTYFETIEAALEDIGAPHHARAALTDLLNKVEWNGVFTPNSKSYVAVTRSARIVASAGKTYVYYPDRPVVYLPEYLWAEGGGVPAQEPLRGEVCLIHGYERSVTGVCPGCE